MVFKVYNLFKIVLILLCLITIVQSQCKISLDPDPVVKPNLSKKIGSHKIKISNNYDHTLLENNEELIATCDNKFERPNQYKGSKELVIKCIDDYVHVNERSYSESIYLKCASLKWNLYELSEKFIWCPWNMTSYVLARPEDDLESYMNLAGICYDIDNVTPASLYYNMAPRHMKNSSPGELEKYYLTPREEIIYINEAFGTKSITSEFYDNQQFKDWIQYANYQFNSIIQNPILYNEAYKEIGSLLDFVWWPNLRLGNWKRYEDALATHVENDNNSYDILAGISGVVTAPVKEMCQNNYTMKELLDNDNQKIPLYVWNYLQPTTAHNSSDEVVVIGVNSPFYEFHSDKEVIFCQDICTKIDWLKNVCNSFRYSTMGVMFCCSVEEVKSSKRLNGFPENVHDSNPITTPTPLPYIYKLQTTSVYESNESKKSNERTESKESNESNESNEINESKESDESDESSESSEGSESYESSEINTSEEIQYTFFG